MSAGNGLADIADVVRAVAEGRPVIMVDDEDRENEGDVVLAASAATPQLLGWVVRHSSGYICAPMPDDVADRLGLPLMVRDTQDPLRTAYTVSVDARQGISTGISATDRARTLRLLADPSTAPTDLVRPGHVLPLRARPGGVLERPGHTEAAVDLCRAAGLPPVGVICELVGDDGEPLRLPGLLELGREHGIPVGSIADLVRRRLDRGDAVPASPRVGGRVQRVAEADLPTRHGRFRARAYRDMLTGAEHLAIVADGPAGPATAPADDAAAGTWDTAVRPGGHVGPEVLVRVHSECLTGDALGSLRCDCGPQLDAALDRIAEHGGVVVYLRGHEGRGIGLGAKTAAYALQDAGLDTVDANTVQGLPADAREYGAAAAVLADLDVTQVRLLTNNTDKVADLATAGIGVVERLPLVVGTGPDNVGYLNVKRDRMGHVLPGELGPVRAGRGHPHHEPDSSQHSNGRSA